MDGGVRDGLIVKTNALIISVWLMGGVRDTAVGVNSRCGDNRAYDTRQEILKYLV